MTTDSSTSQPQLDSNKLVDDLKKLRDFIKRKKYRYEVNCPKFYTHYERLHRLVLSAANELTPSSAEAHPPKQKTFFARLSTSDVDEDDVTQFPIPTRRRCAELIRKVLIQWMSPLMGVVYAVSRLTVIALAFSSLRDMPETVYRTTWAKYFPALQ